MKNFTVLTSTNCRQGYTPSAAPSPQLLCVQDQKTAVVLWSSLVWLRITLNANEYVQ